MALNIQCDYIELRKPFYISDIKMFCSFSIGWRKIQAVSEAVQDVTLQLMAVLQLQWWTVMSIYALCVCVYVCEWECEWVRDRERESEHKCVIQVRISACCLPESMVLAIVEMIHL